MPASVSSADLWAGLSELRLDLDEGRRFRHISAEGGVNFRISDEDGWQVTCESAEAFFAAGGVLKQVIGRGKVHVADQGRTLTCNRVQLFFETRDGSQRPYLARAVADHNVTLDFGTERRLRASGDRLQWDPDADTFVLTGDPHASLIRDDVHLTHERMILDRQSGELSLPRGKTPVRIRASSR